MANISERMDLRSMHISDDNKAKLKQLFPTVFTETRSDNGELVESIDFEKLKAELSTFSDLFESRRERYGMDWPGKKECMKLIQQPSVATLKPCREESVNFDETENLFIEGDNLEVLKLLQKSYYGNVKMIYIDPPYNTGNEFIYPDKYSESLDTYLAYAGLVDDEGKKFSTNTPNEGRFHTKWLNMMYPRLYLARNLLSKDGVIFISIDDNELSNLKKLCDEIFGEENFVGNIAWKKTSGDNKPVFAFTHDNILIYSKLQNTFPRVPLTKEQQKQYKNPDNDPRGDWAESDYRCKWSKNERPNLYYPIVNPHTEEEIYPDSFSESLRVWGCEPTTHQENVKNNMVWWGVDGKSKEPKKKRFLIDHNGANTRSVWLDAGTNDEGSKELREILNGDYFDNPKPVKLLRKLLNTICKDNDICLDFFSGSCTTAHAVLDLNKEDDSNRKFIMVQLPEPCDENTEAFKAGYNTIAEIGKERIRRVINKIKENQSSQNHDLFDSDKPSQDLGFKVYKLDMSNFKVWQELSPDASDEEIFNRLQEHIFHIVEKATQEEILYELLLKAGFKLTEPTEKLELAGKTVYSIADGALMICLENEIIKELIDAVAEAEPLQFICLDQGFRGNDHLKANTVQTFKAKNVGREKESQIVFRTV